MLKKRFGYILSGGCAGIVNGLFGAGGGMVLVPLLTKTAEIEDRDIFPTSVAIILPICVTSLIFRLPNADFSWSGTLPYLLGSGLGGLAAGLFGRRIPTIWLHRILGVLILWGGIRYLC